jgi:hypothetical protein
MVLTFDASSVRDMLGQRCTHVIVLVDCTSGIDSRSQLRDNCSGRSPRSGVGSKVRSRWIRDARNTGRRVSPGGRGSATLLATPTTRHPRNSTVALTRFPRAGVSSQLRRLSSQLPTVVLPFGPRPAVVPQCPQQGASILASSRWPSDFKSDGT